MSLELAFAQQQVRDMQSRVHNFASSVGNALERIGIYIDEDERDEAQRELLELREALGRISDQNDTPTYVTIYDVGDPDDADESYYGYFASAEDAERMYRDLSERDPSYHNARVCLVVKDLPND